MCGLPLGVDFNTSDYISITFQKFNFYILSQNFGDIILNKQYLQICQGNNSPKELYFYVNNDKKENRYNYIDIFIPVLGNYDSFFINEKEIKTLSDFNFNNIKESNFFQISKSTDSGYLKIKCEKPAMVNHICITGDYDLNLTSGKRYIFPKSRVREYNFTFEEKLINKSITLKFTLFGSSNNTSIEFYLNEELKILNNTTPLELLYTYEYYNPNLINFKNNIEEDFCIEIIVGFLEEDLKLYKQIDFTDSLGNIVLEPKEGYIIKIPEEFNQDLYDYSIIIQSSYINIQIYYDKIDFIVPNANDIYFFFL